MNRAASARPCPGCGARLRPDAAWCSLCFRSVSGPTPPPTPPATPSTTLPEAPSPTPPPTPSATLPEGAASPTVPLQRGGPLSPARSLTGGDVPHDVVDGLAAGLAAQVRGEATPRRRARPAVVAAVGAFVVLVVLLVGMTALGALLPPPGAPGTPSRNGMTTRPG
jgi:hypothetical protein